MVLANLNLLLSLDRGQQQQPEICSAEAFIHSIINVIKYVFLFFFKHCLCSVNQGNVYRKAEESLR